MLRPHRTNQKRDDGRDPAEAFKHFLNLSHAKGFEVRYRKGRSQQIGRFEGLVKNLNTQGLRDFKGEGWDCAFVSKPADGTETQGYRLAGYILPRRPRRAGGTCPKPVKSYAKW